VNKAYLAAGELHVEMLGRGIAWLDTGTHDSLLQASNYIQAIEERQGLMVACLEEVALNMGFLDAARVREEAERMKGNGYGRYLLGVFSRSRRAPAEIDPRALQALAPPRRPFCSSAMRIGPSLAAHLQVGQLAQTVQDLRAIRLMDDCGPRQLSSLGQDLAHLPADDRGQFLERVFDLFGWRPAPRRTRRASPRVTRDRLGALEHQRAFPGLP